MSCHLIYVMLTNDQMNTSAKKILLLPCFQQNKKCDFIKGISTC